MKQIIKISRKKNEKIQKFECNNHESINKEVTICSNNFLFYNNSKKWNINLEGLLK